MITKKYKAGDINIIAGKGGGDPLTRVDVLPEPSEETYNENKIYENNNQLSYVGKDVNVEFNVSTNSITAIETRGFTNIKNSYYFITINSDYYKIHGDIYSINVNTGAYSILKSDPILAAENAIGLGSYNDELYIFYKSQGIYKYNIQSQQFSKLSASPSGMSNLPPYGASTAVIGTNMYLIQHEIFSGAYNFIISKFDLTNNTFTPNYHLCNSNRGGAENTPIISIDGKYLCMAAGSRFIKYNTESNTDEYTDFSNVTSNNFNYVGKFGNDHYVLNTIDGKFSICKLNLSSKKLEKAKELTSDQTAPWKYFQYFNNDKLFICINNGSPRQFETITFVENVSYSSIPVGTEYEWVMIIKNDSSVRLPYNISTERKVKYWYIKGFEDNYATPDFIAIANCPFKQHIIWKGSANKAVNILANDDKNLTIENAVSTDQIIISEIWALVEK